MKRKLNKRNSLSKKEAIENLHFWLSKPIVYKKKEVKANGKIKAKPRNG